jgi:hypothetical protein
MATFCNSDRVGNIKLRESENVNLDNCVCEENGEWLSASIKILQQFVAHSIEFSPGRQRSVHFEWKNEDQLR